jgi:CRP-like cAMP-binding protein
MVALDVLNEVRFLHDVPDSHLQELAAIAEVQDLPVNTVVFREGQVSSAIYLVLTGTVALEIFVPGRGAAPLHTAGPGELLGWSPVLRSGAMTATARVVSPARLIVLNASQLLAVCEHNPRFGMEIMRRTALALAVRLDATRLQLLDVYSHELCFLPEEGGTA